MADLRIQIPQLPPATTIADTDLLHIRDATRDRKITYADFFSNHLGQSNPHNITKATIGLDEVSNVPVFDRRELFSEISSTADKATARSNLDIPSFSDLSAAVPQGVIMMWSGAVADIPTGYGLCDGVDGRPNLLGKFIVGGGSVSYPVGATGGQINNDHTHSSTINPHKLTWNEIPPHRHNTGGGDGNVRRSRFGIDPRYGKGQWGWEYGDNDAYYWLTANTVFHPTIAGAYRHGEGSNDAHSHSSSVGGATLDNRPPYFALAYIIKL